MRFFIDITKTNQNKVNIGDKVNFIQLYDKEEKILVGTIHGFFQCMSARTCTGNNIDGIILATIKCNELPYGQNHPFNTQTSLNQLLTLN